MKLFSPQHWAQTRNDKTGAWCTTTWSHISLHWDHGKSKRTIRLDKHSNTAVLHTAPGIRRMQSYCTEITDETNVDLLAFPTLISDDEQSTSNGDNDDDSSQDTSPKQQKTAHP